MSSSRWVSISFEKSPESPAFAACSRACPFQASRLGRKSTPVATVRHQRIGHHGHPLRHRVAWRAAERRVGQSPPKLAVAGLGRERAGEGGRALPKRRRRESALRPDSFAADTAGGCRSSCSPSFKSCQGDGAYPRACEVTDATLEGGLDASASDLSLRAALLGGVCKRRLSKRGGVALYEGGRFVKSVGMGSWASGRLSMASRAHLSIASSREDQVKWEVRSGGASQKGPSMRPEPARRLPGRRVGCG